MVVDYLIEIDLLPGMNPEDSNFRSADADRCW